MSDQIADLFKEDNIPESNWFKFDKVGTKVGGVLVSDPSVKEGQGEFPDQRVFELRTKDGSIVNVGISMNKDYIIQRTNHVRQGDMVGFEFVKEVPASKKGYAPAKSIEVYVKLTEDGDRAREMGKDF